MPEAIVADHLSRVFGGTLRAVDDVSFSVSEGERFGFLGPNGAGKTTTVSMLTAGLAPTSGRATVAGLDVGRHAEEVKRRIGIVFQETSSDGDLTGRENIELAAGLYGLPRRESRPRIQELLERMQLSDAADRLVKTYSGGMRRRLELAVGIIHSPHLLFLDEPTLGLDPQGRAGFWQYVLELQKRDQITVFVTTHYLDEADQLCDRIAIIDHGKLVASGTPSELKGRLGGDVITLTTPASAVDLTGALSALPGSLAVVRQDGTYRLKCSNGEAMIPGVVETFSRSGVGLLSVALKRPSLDEVFLEFTGREFREDEGPTTTDRAVMIRQFQNRIRSRGRR